MNIKKQVAMAGAAAAALATFSMPSHAMRMTDAGEANLVPFVLWDSDPDHKCGRRRGGIDVAAVTECDSNGAPTTQSDGRKNFIGINTIVKLTIPAAVGGDVIPNFFTAPWTTPTNGTKLNPGLQDPAAFTGTKQIHWHFLDIHSLEVTNGTINVTPDDVYVFDWAAIVAAQGRRDLDGQPGYLVFNTETAESGVNAADFSFFAEAWMIAGINSDLFCDHGCNFTGVVGLVDSKIPVIPMSDGADTIGQAPTVANQVVSRSLTQPIVSPLVGGIRTNWSDGDGTDVKVVDVTLGNRSIPIGETFNPFQLPTLVVAWNDRNEEKWANVKVEVFNDDEESCSGAVDLVNQLNLLWVQTDITASHPFIWPVPDFIEEWGTSQVLCVPPVKDVSESSIANLKKILSGGFVEFFLPEPVDNGLFAPESSAVFFSLPFQYHVNLQQDPIDGDVVPVSFSLIPFETALGHDRGMFSQ